MKGEAMLFPEYMKTSTLAKMIDRNRSWIEERIGSEFHEGIHFFRKKGGHYFWKKEAVIEWIESSCDPEADEILERVMKGVA